MEKGAGVVCREIGGCNHYDYSWTEFPRGTHAREDTAQHIDQPCEYAVTTKDISLDVNNIHPLTLNDAVLLPFSHLGNKGQRVHRQFHHCCNVNAVCVGCQGPPPVLYRISLYTVKTGMLDTRHAESLAGFSNADNLQEKRVSPFSRVKFKRCSFLRSF